MRDNDIKKQKHEQVTVVRSGKYVFRYDSGFEHEVMSHLLEMIFDERIDFGWSDAALVSFGMIEGLIKERGLYQKRL